jgi:AcrR family transcriptional regulator
MKMKSAKANRTYRKILDASMRLFNKKGYHGTSISEIAEATHLTKGAIYFHFKNKDSLLKEILNEYERTFLDQLFKEVQGLRESPMEKIKQMLRFTLNFPLKHRQLCLCLTILSVELYGSGPKYEKDLRRIYRKYHHFVKELITKGKEEGSIREEINPDLVALTIIGAHEGNLVQWMMNMNRIKGKDFAKSFMRFLLNAISR